MSRIVLQNKVPVIIYGSEFIILANSGFPTHLIGPWIYPPGNGERESQSGIAVRQVGGVTDQERHERTWINERVKTVNNRGINITTVFNHF